MERKRRETPWADKVEHWQQVVDPTLSCSRWQQGFRENDFKVFSPGNPPNSCNLKPLTHLCQELSKTLEAGMECRNTSSLFHTEAKYEWHVNYSGRQTWITVKKKKPKFETQSFPNNHRKTQYRTFSNNLRGNIWFLMWQNSCYRSCAHGQSLLCLQLRADEKMTLYPRLCVKTANNSDKSYCNRMRSILIWYQKNWERSEFNGRPFVSKLWHSIRAVFCHVYLQSFLFLFTVVLVVGCPKTDLFNFVVVWFNASYTTTCYELMHVHIFVRHAYIWARVVRKNICVFV